MTEQVAESAVALARMRVLGTHVVTGPRWQTAALQAAAERAGRRIVDATAPDAAAQVLTLGWLEGSEPVAGGDSGVFRADPTPESVLTFAAALRACWLEPADMPFPGAAASVESILEARAILGTISGSDGNEGKSAEHHRKGALRRLRQAGYLTGDETTVRLGPVVATWSEGQVNVLRTVYDQLPVAAETYVAIGPSVRTAADVAGDEAMEEALLVQADDTGGNDSEGTDGEDVGPW